jgi:hypothetical protein
VELHHASLKGAGGGRCQDLSPALPHDFYLKRKDYKVDNSDYKVDES